MTKAVNSRKAVVGLPADRRRSVRLVHKILACFGLEVRRYRAHPYRPPAIGAEPRTILDVGAADGTSGLYESYPDAFVVAFEPLVEQLNRLHDTLGKRPHELVAVALGSSPGEVEFLVDIENPKKSSFHEQTALIRSSRGTVPRSVSVATLDSLLQSHEWKPPYALKINTSGHEPEVLRGASETLKQTVVLYCEMSVSSRFEGGYQFSDVATPLIAQGFELVDILNAPRGRDGRTALINCVWVPRGV